MSSLSQPPPPPVGPLISSTLSALIPEGLTLQTFNATYVQQHKDSPLAVLAGAKVAQILGSPKSEVEEAVFAMLNPDIQLSVKVCSSILQSSLNIHGPRSMR